MEIMIWLILGLVIGGIVGALATWMISRARGGAVSVMQLKQENDRFKNEVTEHFVETARLINQMTDSYKQVFDHLSSGAEKLVDEKSLAERLPPASGQEVKLSQFGASVSSGKDSVAPQTSAPARASSSTAGESAASADKPSRPSGGADPLKRSTGASGSSGSGSSDSKAPEKPAKAVDDSKSADGTDDERSRQADPSGDDATKKTTSGKGTSTSSQPGDAGRDKD